MAFTRFACQPPSDDVEESLSEHQARFKYIETTSSGFLSRMSIVLGVSGHRTRAIKRGDVVAFEVNGWGTGINIYEYAELSAVEPFGLHRLELLRKSKFKR